MPSLCDLISNMNPQEEENISKYVGGSSMEFHQIYSDQKLTISLVGALSFKDSSDYQNVLNQIDALVFTELEINLCDLHFIDAAGLGMLVLLIEKVEARNISVELLNSVGQVKKLLSLAKIPHFDYI